jgi:phosphate-selective porin OprO/OprP
MNRIRLILGSIGLVLLTTANVAWSADLTYDVPGGDLELDWNRPGRSVRFVSEDGNIDLRPGVRLHVDALVTDDDITDLNDDIEIRKLRLHLRARLFQDWRFKIDGEFSPDRDVDWRNLWVSYRGFERVDIRVGNRISPAGLDAATSSDNLTFMERSLADALTPGFQFGGSVRTWSPFGSATVGVFSAPVFEKNDRNHSKGVSVASRLTFAPWIGENHVLHLGMSGVYRALGNSSQYRVRTRPEVGSLGRLINTGRIRGIDDAFTFGVEAAIVNGPFSAQGEYLRTELFRPGSNLMFNGGYIQGSVFLTGESRPYSVPWGSFRWIEPKRTLGALEFALRWSRLDLDDSEIRGGNENNYTVGVNWYLNKNVRLMFNAVFADIDLPKNGVNDNPNLYQFRLQVVF